MADDETIAKRGKNPTRDELLDETGRFRPGNPGGPGRPKGKRSRVAEALDGLGEAAARDVLDVVLTAARGGDVQAARLVFDRVWQPRRGRLIEVPLPATDDAAGVSAAFATILDQVAAGALTADEARPVADLLEARRRAIETAELAERIEALESATKQGGGR